MSAEWGTRLVAKVESRMAEDRWRDSLWLRASSATDVVLSRVFARGTPGATTTPDRTPFRIASVTKVYVAAVIFRLLEGGRLELEETLSTLVSPDTTRQLARAGYDPARIRVDDLLRHTSGMRDHSACDEFVERLKAEPSLRWTRSEQIALTMDLGAPLCEPGSRFFYSDTGYVILGEIVERVTGLTLPLATRTLLGFDRLGLRHTFFDGSDDAHDDPTPLARQWIDDVDGTGFDASFDLFGGGGLVSTLEDIDAFFRSLFDGRVFDRPSTLDRIFHAPPTTCGFDGFTHNGLMFRKQANGVDCWGHTGFWGVLAAYVPERRAMLAATLNRSRAEGAYDPDELLLDFTAAVA